MPRSLNHTTFPWLYQRKIYARPSQIHSLEPSCQALNEYLHDLPARNTHAYSIALKFYQKRKAAFHRHPYYLDHHRANPSCLHLLRKWSADKSPAMVPLKFDQFRSGPTSCSCQKIPFHVPRILIHSTLQ